VWAKASTSGKGLSPRGSSLSAKALNPVVKVPPSSPVVLDVNLLYIPGLDDESKKNIPQ
jgi:hypothetical protein